MNRIYIIGNLVDNPVARTTPIGLNNSSFRVAVNEKKGEKNQATFFDCTAWDKLGEVCQKYLSKGSSVYVEGKAHCTPYIGKDGKAHGNVQISVQNIEFLSQKKQEEKKDSFKEFVDSIGDLNPDDIPY